MQSETEAETETETETEMALALARRIGRWIWAGGAAEAHWAQQRRLPFWEHPWFTRVYRIGLLSGWAAVIAFLLLWNLVWATP